MVKSDGASGGCTKKMSPCGSEVVMKGNVRKSGSVVIALLLAALILVMAVACTTIDKTGGSASNVNTAERLTRIEDIDLSGIRAEHFTAASVKQNETASFDGDRWVIVELSDDSLFKKYSASGCDGEFSDYCKSEDGLQAKEEMQKAHRKFLSYLDENEITYNYKYSYTALTDGVAIKVNASAYDFIKSAYGVKSVNFSENYAAPKVAVSNNANVYTTGIYDSSKIGYKGEGMVVAVLDTGLDYTHEAFGTMPENPKWDKAYVASRMENNARFNAQATADEVYYNAKVPFAYDYADDDPDVYPSYSTHGTHVAGIVAGKSNYKVNRETGETFIGVAPEAQLVICKVFTDNLDSDSLGGADTMDIIAAVSDCVELGVDVINMSLGSSAGFADEKSDTFLNDIYASVKAAGISLVVAASNDYSSGFGGGNGTNLASNPDSGTVGSPSTYDAALSVASINGQKSSYITANNDPDQVAFITESSDENGNEFDFIDLLYKQTGKAKTETLNYKYVVIGGVGRATNYTSLVKNEINNYKQGGYDGVIALVKRGDTTFAEKVQLAMDNGVSACIIYNNVSGTIRMSLGEVSNPVPTCAITMDAGKVFVENANSRGVGSIQIRDDYKAGPFMSDFSSWGPMPDLQLKPEISAHGGEITSAVPGGYDVYSGTSMAAPNMAGAIALLRQYLKTANPGLTGTALNARINQVLMSTATIALNEEGNPYSPRKQGAGLAGIADAINTESYITVLDANGKERDKTKIELYDDPKRTGKYTLDFVVNNISGKAETYVPTVFVMTETLASDNKTVAEKARMLTDSTIKYSINGTESNANVTVPANGKVSVRVEITLGSEGRKYIENSFKNGMYVEGFVSLKGVNEGQVTIGLPYLAFYGDWTDAPLFDYDTYEIAESKKDTSVEEEDKLKASAADTKLLGMYYDDKYIISLGGYLYEMDETDVAIYPEREKAAVSMYDETGNRTIYELYMVYAGLLRGAAYMDLKITDGVTGEVVYQETQENVGKSYAAGGSNRGSPIMIEIKPNEWNMQNNRTYYVSLKGKLDYKENPEKEGKLERDDFYCRFTIDYEAPQVLDYRIRYESYTENRQVKYRIYMDVDVFDNQYVMDVMPCYAKKGKDGVTNELTLLTEHPIPVYGQKGETSTVSFEITDIYDEYVKNGQLYIAVEDYAMNQSTYTVNVATASEYPESVTLKTDDKLFATNEKKQNGDKKDGLEYNVYELTLAPNELYKPVINALPDGAVSRALSWFVQEGASYVATNVDEIFAIKENVSNKVTLVLADNDGKDESKSQTIYAQINVFIEGEALDKPKAEKLTLGPAINNEYYAVTFEGASASIKLNPNQTVTFKPSVTPWYFESVNKLEYVWTGTNDDIFTVNEIGTVTAKKKGSAYVTVTAKDYPLLTKTVKIVVGDEFRVSSYTLYDYYGEGECVIPEDKNVMMIDEKCFQYNTKLTKVVFPSTCTEIPENAFLGCTNLEEIVIPSQCIVIRQSAFENCKKLKKITFQNFVDRDKIEHEDYHGAITIGKYAFRNCTSLTEIVNQARLTTVLDEAFAGCTALTSIDISELRVTGSAVFSGCESLSEVVTGAATNVGKNMFQNCTALRSVEFAGEYLNAQAFSGCTSLKTLTLTAKNFTGIGDEALAGTSIEELRLPDGNCVIGKNAFANNSSLKKIILSENTKLTLSASSFANCRLFGSYELPASGSNYYSVEDGILYNKDKTVLLSVPCGKDTLGIASSVTEIAEGAFSGIYKVNAVASIKNLDLSALNITKIGKYAFSGSGIEEITLPEGLEVLPEGVFSDCTKLAKVNGTESVTEISDYAFSGCTAIRTMSFPNVTKIGNYAFYRSGIRTLDAPETLVIGESAFRSSYLTEAIFEKTTEIGSMAFSSNNSLTKVSLGAVTVMGDRAFYGSGEITSFAMAEGAKVVGNYAFYYDYTSQNVGRTALTEVILPDSTEIIGEYAFFNVPNLVSVNLSGVKTIGECAFAYAVKLADVDLSNVVTIGNSAFAYTAIEEADLSNAKYIGETAFYETDGGKLRTLTLGKVEIIGDYAFYGTKLTTVEIPATMKNRFYDYSWEELDDKGRVEKKRTRKIASYGTGAFAGITTLTEIKVAEGNEDFFAIDGVLYAKTEYAAFTKAPVTDKETLTAEETVGEAIRAIDGFVLVQYPAAKEGTEYTVADKTVVIGDSAFEQVKNLKKVKFPYTVKAIGSLAFYASSVDDYTFTSVNAPALYATPVTSADFDSSDILYSIYAPTTVYGLESTIYYANFYDYVAKRIYNDLFADKYKTKSFGLKLTIPKNGKGYDSTIWSNFFEEEKNITYTDIAADDTTHEAIEAVQNIEKVMKIDDISKITTVDGIKAISDAVYAARKAFNKVTSAEQKSLVAEIEANLLKAEAAIRETKKALGIPVAVKELAVASDPVKLRYKVGETFDKTGLVIKLVFEDLSEIVITDYKLNKEVLENGDRSVIATYTYEGKEYSVEILLNVESSGDGPDGPDGPVDPEKKDNKAVIIAVSVVVPAVVLAGVAVAVILVLKKKKKAKQVLTETESAPETEKEKEEPVAEIKEQAEKTEETEEENEEK